MYSKTCPKQPLKIDKTKILKTNGSLMKVFCIHKEFIPGTGRMGIIPITIILCSPFYIYHIMFEVHRKGPCY